MLSFGLYLKQLLLFATIGLFFVGFGWVVGQQRSEAAAGRPIALPAQGDRLVLAIDVADQGAARILGTTVTNTVSFERGYDEFRYLLVTDLPRPIAELAVTLSFPRPVSDPAGGQNVLVIYSPESRWEGAWLDETTYQYTIHNLQAGSSVTLVSRLPKGIILPSVVQQVVGPVLGWPHLLWLTATLIVPLGAVLVGLFVLGWGQVRRRRSARIASRPPDERLSPAHVAGLVDGRISIRALAATMLDLARRGYLEIGHRLGTYTFTKRKLAFDESALGLLAGHERILLDKLFANGQAQATDTDVRVRIGQQLFSEEVAELYLVLYESLTASGFFRQSPSLIQGTYRLAGLSLFFLSLLGFFLGAIFYNQNLLPLIFWVIGLGSGLLIVARASVLSPYTAAGSRARETWLAFKNYLRDTSPLDWQTVNQQVYVDYLPYAVALGVEGAWSARFMKAPFQIPDWYHGEIVQGEVAGFTQELLPMISFLAHELAATKDPTLS